MEKYFEKGSKVLLCGRIQTGSYENQEGNKVYTTDVVVEEINSIGNKKEKTEKEPDTIRIDEIDNFLD